MLDLEKIKKGDHVWKAHLQFTKSRKRTYNYSTPTEYIFLEVGGFRGIYSKIKDPTTDREFNVPTADLYHTKEDADEEWNRIVYDALDYIQHEYELRKRYITKFLTNYGR